MSQNYDDLVKMIEEIEKSSTKVDFNSLDISSLEVTDQLRPKPQFLPLLDLAIRMESGKSINEQNRQNKQTAAAAKQQIIHPTLEKQQVGIATKNELGKFADRLEKKQQPQQPIATFDPKQGGELSLSNLSVSDQISELEQIIKGVISNSFDYDHLESVKKEVYKLNSDSIRDMMSGSKKKASQAALELIKLRDQRLSEAMKLLGDSK